ncbi:exported hypothetical protein [Xenorhabdus bovienii str. oregonense]|uniref:Uncharacterized protein n=2 Tax=Xenorhabdus bovienii TaxID=40576 RepID=A0A077NSD6_XENBV|nr:exported hypothetical protein [Xenorhabdus bovienii str. oregonense]
MVRLAATASIPGTTMSLSSPGKSSAYRAITAVVLSPDLNYFLIDNLVTSIKTGKNLNLIANDHVVTSGSKLISGENLSILSGGDIRLRALPKEKYTRSNDSYEYQTIESTELSAKGLLTLSAEGNILFQATKLAVEGLKNISSVISDTTLDGVVINKFM